MDFSTDMMISFISLPSDMSERILRLLSRGSPAPGGRTVRCKGQEITFADLKANVLFSPSLGADTLKGMTPVF